MSTRFSGSESSGKVIVSIVMLGGTVNKNVRATIRLKGASAKGNHYSMH